MADIKAIPTLAGARARRAMEEVDLPQITRPAPPAQYQRDIAPIPPEYVEEPGDRLFPDEAPTTTTTRPTPKPAITLATTIAHRGRQITITATDLTADQFCDLLDKRGFAPPAPASSAAPLATPDDLPDGWKLCQRHGAPMRPRNKQNETWHNVGTKDSPIWCKGYRGSDSPGYEL
jgi:hypothetical protein